MGTFLLFDGALNTAILGLPAYIWLMLVLLIFTVGSYALWYFFFWLPLKPVQGHFISHFNKTNSALTFDEHLNFVMKSEKKAKLIFDITTKDAKELQKDWDYAPSGLIGKVLCDLMFVTNDWNKIGSPTRVAIESIAAAYNETHDDDQVMTLEKFYKRLMEGAFNGYEGVLDIKTTYRVNWRRIDFAIPKDHIQPMWDGYLRQLAKMINEDTNAGSAGFGYVILGGSVLISLAMLALKFLS